MLEIAQSPQPQATGMLETVGTDPPLSPPPTGPSIITPAAQATQQSTFVANLILA
jgi:hypothetical protein